MVEREIVDSIKTVRRTLKKTNQALAEGVLVPPASEQCRIRVRHGGRAGGHHREYQGLVCLEDQQATGAGDP